MKKPITFLAITLIILIGCVSNPVNRATSDNYAKTCSREEQKGNLNAAEQACYRALVNVDWGNLGPELKSERLYNLARIKRWVAKFNEAEDLLTQSLEIEENLPNTSNTKIGRRLAELSVNLAAQNRWLEGLPHVQKLSNMANNFSGQELSFVIKILQQYGDHLNTIGKNNTAVKLHAKARELQSN